MRRRTAFWTWVFADENRRYWSIGGTILVITALLHTLVDIWRMLD
jgi:hypothetical protein